MKYKNLKTFALFGITSLFLFSPCLTAWGQSYGDISVTGTLLKFDPETPGNYKIEIQWPIAYMGQWTKMLESFDNTPEELTVKNPIFEKEDNVIVLSQVNPDGISGENVFFSENGYIMRIERAPLDALYRDTKGFYEFLKKELKRHDEGFASRQLNSITDDAPIVVLFHESETLRNPVWKITDPEEIKIYKRYLDGLKRFAFSTNITLKTSKADDEFAGLNTFSVFVNFKNAPVKEFLISRSGNARSSKVTTAVHCYADAEKFYEILKSNAQETIENEKRIEALKKQSELERKF